MKKITLFFLTIVMVLLFQICLKTDLFANGRLRIFGGDIRITNVDSLISISHQYLYEAQYKKSLGILNYAYNLSLIKKDKYSTIEVLRNIGNVFDESGDYKNAMHYYYMALQQSSSGEFFEQKASLHINIGVTYFNMKETENALREYQTAIEIAKTIGDTLITIKALNNIGNVYMSLEQDVENSIYYFEQVSLLSKKINYVEGIYTGMGNLAQIHMYIGDIDAAELAIGELMSIDSTDVYVLFALANLYRVKQMHLDAIRTMEIALEGCTNQFELEQVIHKDLTDMYSEIGKFEKALYHFTKYAELKENFHTTESKRYVMELQKKYQIEKKESQIRHLHAERERTKLINVFLILSLFFITGIGFLVFINYRKKITIAKQNIQLSNQKVLELEHERIISASIATIQGEES